MRSIAMGVSVYFVCPLACLNNQTSGLYQIFYIIFVAVAQASSDDNAIRQVLPVSLMP